MPRDRRAVIKAIWQPGDSGPTTFSMTDTRCREDRYRRYGGGLARRRPDPGAASLAIKMLAAMHADDEQFRARFRAEARYASSRAHPGITGLRLRRAQPPGRPYRDGNWYDGAAAWRRSRAYARLEPYVVLDIVAPGGAGAGRRARAGSCTWEGNLSPATCSS